MKDFLKDKKAGFWVSVAVTLLSLVTAIVYIASYNNTDNFHVAAFILLLAAVVCGVLLAVFRQYKLVPYVQALFVFLALLFFIYGIYYYVSVLAVGIDIQEVAAEFVASTLLFALTFVLSIVNVFLNQIGEVKNNV